ncbi:hypothetical protein [Streptomyces sp. H39-S7]|uniref:hypothetical protein n=1 Tax=Streptomyces sp. H39-S7 TaxID=3004357 RepID=UPI0022B006DC|nr:hypothetical protein [Streptomyces sp. H39-S7]MCZ4123672.1 hypothetical protein [Streptomyces sp. H39-S7]
MKELASDGVPVAVACRVLKLARQPYDRWLDDPVTAAEFEQAHRAHALFAAHRDDPSFGYRFLADEARDAGAGMADRTAWRICRNNHSAYRHHVSDVRNYGGLDSTNLAPAFTLGSAMAQEVQQATGGGFGNCCRASGSSDGADGWFERSMQHLPVGAGAVVLRGVGAGGGPRAAGPRVEHRGSTLRGRAGGGLRW